MEPIQVIRGMRDVLPEQIVWWHRMERILAEVLRKYGYQEIRTPILEHAELFERSIGENTDIVEKEMYSFQDRDGERLTLRPEGTAAIARAYIENNIWQQEPVSRWYYVGPMFRHERPQKGRYRQFMQMGVELIGSAEPAADVELLDVMVESISAIGVKDTHLQLNSLGCMSCRPAYRSLLVAYLEKNLAHLCENCQRRVKSNPLRVLDCKIEGCIQVAEGAPKIGLTLCGACSEHFESVQSGLKTLSIPFELNHRMVRGLDYYTRTTFELLAEGLGAQNAVAAGGRYDGLMQILGGPETPALGFAAGLDRILIRLLETAPAPDKPSKIFFVTRGAEGWKASLEAMRQMRRIGFNVESDVRQGSLKAQMKRADKAGATFVVILGEDELRDGTATVKDMRNTDDQQEKQFKVPFRDLPQEFHRRMAGVGGGER